MLIGYAMCGSFCTLSRAVAVMKSLRDGGFAIQPIMSEAVYTLDTRFGAAAERIAEVEEICGRQVIHTVAQAEPLGPKMPLDALVIAPCTGNTLAKMASGITDSAVTMAAKAHLRCDRTTVIALASNDALSQNLQNIAKLLLRRQVFFVPLRQDDPIGKPHSLVAEWDLVPAALTDALAGIQQKPLFQ